MLENTDEILVRADVGEPEQDVEDRRNALESELTLKRPLPAREMNKGEMGLTGITLGVADDKRKMPKDPSKEYDDEEVQRTQS